MISMSWGRVFPARPRKIRIDQEIINKPGKLTDDEMREMKKHPDLGFKILYETEQMTEESKIIVLQHHERYDGTGYPQGFEGMTCMFTEKSAPLPMSTTP